MKNLFKAALLVMAIFGVQTTMAAETAAKSAETVVMATTEQVNINTADADTLANKLIGIGDVKAQAIVEYRSKNGGFKSIEELANVDGIGEATLEKNKNKITLQ